MIRSLLVRLGGGALGAAALALLGGCPVYTGRDYRVCDAEGCFLCPTTSLTRDCMPWHCESASDCPDGTSCSSDGTCKSSEPTSPPPPAPLPPPGDAGPAPTPKPIACTSDAACKAAGPGARCLSGSCVAAADQCTDAAHCGAGQRCLDGACVLQCGSGSACPTGYACEASGALAGLCLPAGTSCGPNGPSCVAPLTCGFGRCVSACRSSADCGAGLSCVNGACIVVETARFSCGPTSDGKACGVDGVCMRRACYPRCPAFLAEGDAADGDAGSADGGEGTDAGTGGGASACSAPALCQEGAVWSGVVTFCGPAQKLGYECSPTARCSAGKHCLDGFCK